MKSREAQTIDESSFHMGGELTGGVIVGGVVSKLYECPAAMLVRGERHMKGMHRERHMKGMQRERHIRGRQRENAYI